MKSQQYEKAMQAIHEAYDNRKSPHYRNNNRFAWAVHVLEKSFLESPSAVKCEFCGFKGERSELERNGHCPKCQSPSTRHK